MKLINYRCECGNQKEEFFTCEEMKTNPPAKFILCYQCNGFMKRFDFKNNKQVWKFTP